MMNNNICWKFVKEGKYVLKADGMEPLAVIHKTFPSTHYRYKAVISCPPLRASQTNFIQDQLLNKLGPKYDMYIEAITYEHITKDRFDGRIIENNLQFISAFSGHPETPDSVYMDIFIHISVRTHRAENDMTQDFGNVIRTLALIYNQYTEICPTCGYEEAEDLNDREIRSETWTLCEICSEISDELLGKLVKENG